MCPPYAHGNRGYIVVDVGVRGGQGYRVEEWLRARGSTCVAVIHGGHGAEALLAGRVPDLECMRGWEQAMISACNGAGVGNGKCCPRSRHGKKKNH